MASTLQYTELESDSAFNAQNVADAMSCTNLYELAKKDTLQNYGLLYTQISGPFDFLDQTGSDYRMLQVGSSNRYCIAPSQYKKEPDNKLYIPTITKAAFLEETKKKGLPCPSETECRRIF